ncbi:MAG: septal ring lytic transglycosylase RlpA family protein [Gammaproteobacteria bacterium]|nr:septal ring lytic transglycosylase RlpA family protein [Gammaproteobacteria bacterium]MCP5197852.1 septal ring lytic transglycosylase RlpA family protein [Gammaproteobacteria bacterium]
MKKSWNHALLFASLAGAMAGCSTVPDQQQQPMRPPADLTHNVVSERSDPIPQAEPPSRSGNPDTYVVFGRRYRVKESSEGHRETGTASWYGWDFHGRKTSSGPPFDMFDLTAAHKSLPIPTYARVTNLENGHSVVVKINDRGPFVGDRIIDLSYAAAARLEMLDQGTARVEVVALAPYQFLPQLAARRAEARERLASRAIESMRKPVVADQSSGQSTQPPVAIREKALSRLAKDSGRGKSTASMRLASAAPVVNSAVRPARAPAATNRGTVDGKVAIAPVTKAGKSLQKITENRVAPINKNSALYVVGTVAERNAARQLQTRLSSQLQRNVQVDASAGQRYEVRVPLRNPGEAKQVAIRLASLGVSRSRIVAD